MLAIQNFPFSKICKVQLPPISGPHETSKNLLSTEEK